MPWMILKMIRVEKNKKQLFNAYNNVHIRRGNTNVSSLSILINENQSLSGFWYSDHTYIVISNSFHSYFWPRATLNGPKRSFVVACCFCYSWRGNMSEKWNKNSAWEQKMFLWVKMKFIKTQWGQSLIFCGPVWYLIESNCRVWPYMTSCGIASPQVALYDLMWSFIVLFLFFAFFVTVHSGRVH